MAFIYINNMLHILNLKDPASFLIWQIFSIYQGFNREPSDQADDIPMCQCASPQQANVICTLTVSLKL